MVEIPLKDFDQSKLEHMLRNSPVAFVKEETHDQFLRRHYLYPRKKSVFAIKCFADHFNASPVPSIKKCSLKTSAVSKGDEIQVEWKNDGLPAQKIYSLERIYGQSYDGSYRQLFRYVFDCSPNTCKMTFATKAAD